MLAYLRFLSGRERSRQADRHLGLTLAFVAGARIDRAASLSASATVLLLCFIMGLQNAIITKVSDARIRTTHVTGLVTDLGIELGKLVYWNRTPEHGAPVRADRDKMGLLSSLLALFVLGGPAGALGFKSMGFIAVVPLAMLLAVMAAVSVLDDLRASLRR